MVSGWELPEVEEAAGSRRPFAVADSIARTSLSGCNGQPTGQRGYSGVAPTPSSRVGSLANLIRPVNQCLNPLAQIEE